MVGLILQLKSDLGGAESFARLHDQAVTIGRAYDNDIILSDPYLGPKQFRLCPKPDGTARVDVLDATNPFHLNDHVSRDSAIILHVGDRLSIGHTTLVLQSADSEVPPARPLESIRWPQFGAWQGLLAVVALLLCCGYAFFFNVQATVQELNWFRLAGQSVLLGAIIVAWACVWAAVGRVLRNRAHFASQLMVSSLMTWLMIQVTVAAGYLEYASNLSWLGEGFDWVMSALVSILLVYFNLQFASNLRRPLLISCVLIGGLFVAVCLMRIIDRQEYQGIELEQPTLKPPFARLSRSKSLDDVLRELPQLFEQ